jgi:hypothetical protein
MITRRLLETGKEARILMRPQSPYALLAEAGAHAMLGDRKDRVPLNPAGERIEDERRP